MVIKFIKLMVLSGFLFLGNAYSVDSSERSMITEDTKYYHKEVKELVDLFYDFYDSYKDELDNSGIQFGQKNYLDIVESNFKCFTGMRMNYYLNDYFNSKIKFSSKQAQHFEKIDFNIYDSLRSTIRFFACCVIGTPAYRANGWFMFFEGLDPVAHNLQGRSKAESTHVIYVNRRANNYVVEEVERS